MLDWLRDMMRDWLSGPTPQPERCCNKQELAIKLAKHLLEAASDYSRAKDRLVDKIIASLEQLGSSTCSCSKKAALEPPEEPHPRPMNDWEKARLEYFQKHALSQYIEHLKFRPLTLQIFLAGEAVLFTAWAREKHWGIAIVGLVACISAWIWDQRTKDLMNYTHEWGKIMADPYFYFSKDIANAIHHRLGPKTKDSTSSWRSWLVRHTVALWTLLVTIGGVWLVILVKSLFSLS